MGMVMLQRHLWATLPTLHFPFNPAGALPVTCANGKTPNITAVVHFKGHQSVGHSQFQPVLSLSFWVGAGQVMEKSRSNLRVTGKCPLTLGMFCSSRFELRYRLLPTEYTHVVSDHKEESCTLEGPLLLAIHRHVSLLELRPEHLLSCCHNTETFLSLQLHQMIPVQRHCPLSSNTEWYSC